LYHQFELVKPLWNSFSIFWNWRSNWILPLRKGHITKKKKKRWISHPLDFGASLYFWYTEYHEEKKGKLFCIFTFLVPVPEGTNSKYLCGKKCTKVTICLWKINSEITIFRQWLPAGLQSSDLLIYIIIIIIFVVNFHYMVNFFPKKIMSIIPL
jgi:hypothetical protein